jgi:hypothetical protein
VIAHFQQSQFSGEIDMTGGTTRGLLGAIAVAAIAATAWFASGTAAQEKPAAKPAAKLTDDPALARARKQVQMLDDLYKSTIVMITENYVTEESDLAAGSAFQKIFKTMKDKGYHEVRLLDATGEPYEAKNKPSDDFEKAAVAALKQGAATHEQVVEKDGHRYLRVATPIHVVMKKCTLCHEHYAKAKPGEPIGALGYMIEVE